MIIKDKIQIGSRNIKIEFVDRLVLDGEEIYGCYKFAEGIIQINSTYPEDMNELTLLHELRHFVWAMLGYYTDEEIKLSEEFIIQQQHYDHQILQQILEWQK